MNIQIAHLDGEPCVLHWYDCHKQKPRDVVSKADMDCSMVYEREQITAQGVKPPVQPDDELYTHAVATFRDEKADQRKAEGRAVRRVPLQRLVGRGDKNG